MPTKKSGAKAERINRFLAQQKVQDGINAAASAIAEHIGGPHIGGHIVDIAGDMDWTEMIGDPDDDDTVIEAEKRLILAVLEIWRKQAEDL